MVERWKDIPGYAGAYQASSEGRVRSLDRYVRCGRNGAGLRLSPGRVLRPAPSTSGHLSVVLGKGNTCAVHVCVARAFLGEPPHKHEVLHGDHDPTNNRLVNLRYGTRSENLLHDYTTGNRVGNKHPNFIGARWRA